MDPTLNDHQVLEQIEAIDDLLEDFWFFDNLLDRRSRILRYCHSDPYPLPPSSSSTCPKYEFSKTEDSDSDKKVLKAPVGRDSVPLPCIVNKEGGTEPEKINKMRRQFSEKIRVQERRAYLQKKEPVVREKGIRESSKKNRTGTSSSFNNNSLQSCPMGGSLQRTQTLPSYIGREDVGNEFEDQEIDDSRMGFLIREAIASSSSEFTPTKLNTPKSSSIPRPKPPRHSRSEEAIQEMVFKSQRIPSRKTLRKTLSSVDTKELLMLKDLDIDESERKQEKYEEEQSRIARAAVKSRSAAVVGQPIPVWVPKESRKDMKAQIKFWARTVASNVRQEC
ncbi:Serine/arginine repetitive matrix protein [Hirschfeldia incana]|nr:Serine/arginine repetitive matrix protein [Hirschfeldia incana]